MRLGQLARELGCENRGDGEIELRGVASLEAAGPGDLAFVRSAAWGERMRASRAAALIVPIGFDAVDKPSIVSANPGLDFARAARRLAPEPVIRAGVHTSAVVD